MSVAGEEHFSSYLLAFISFTQLLTYYFSQNKKDGTVSSEEALCWRWIFRSAANVALPLPKVAIHKYSINALQSYATEALYETINF